MRNYKDFTNLKFENFEVLERVGTAKSGASLWSCKCKCGNIKNAYGSDINRNKFNCEICKEKPKVEKLQTIRKLKNTENFIGVAVNSFIVKERIKNQNGSRLTNWLCECTICKNLITKTSTRIKKASFACKICKEKNRIKDFKPLSTRKNPNDIAFNICYNRHVKSAKSRNYEFEITKEYFKEITKQNCFYCNEKPKNCAKSATGGVYTYNGIDRVDNSIGYINKNIVSCCKKCNYMKHTNTLEEFKERIEKIYLNICKK